MSAPVLETLIGRVPKMISAFLPGYHRYPVRNLVFPGVIPAIDKKLYTPKPVSNRLSLPHPLESIGSNYVEGMVLTDLTAEEVQVFDWYEDTAYLRSIVSVWIPSSNTNLGTTEVGGQTQTLSEEAVIATSSWKQHETNIYLWANPPSELDQDHDWDYAYFLENRLDWYMENTVRPCRKQLDALQIGVRNTD